MEALKEICKKDGRYKEVIKESYIVKNAVILLGGRRKMNGGGKEMEWKEMGVGEKIKLIELLGALVKGGVELKEEEEMEEVLMELEEEGNKHVEEGEAEEEREGGGEEGKEEKEEWEELSERAHELIWRMEGVKNRREGKKRETMKMMKKEKEEMARRMEEERRGREEEKKRADEEKKNKEEAEERIERMEEEMERMKKEGGIATLQPPYPSTLNAITSLDATSVIFPQRDRIKRERNTIINTSTKNVLSGTDRHCFIGGVMTSVCNLFFSSIHSSFFTPSLTHI